MAKMMLATAAALVVAAGCSGSTPPVSLVGSWSGVITCYSIDSPLSMTVDAATPAKAAMAMGDGGVFPWDAALTVEGAKVTITSDIPNGDARLLTGTADAAGNTITGDMEGQLCNKFTLTRKA